MATRGDAGRGQGRKPLAKIKAARETYHMNK